MKKIILSISLLLLSSCNYFDREIVIDKKSDSSINVEKKLEVNNSTNNDNFLDIENTDITYTDLGIDIEEQNIEEYTTTDDELDELLDNIFE